MCCCADKNTLNKNTYLLSYTNLDTHLGKLYNSFLLYWNLHILFHHFLEKGYYILVPLFLIHFHTTLNID